MSEVNYELEDLVVSKVINIVASLFFLVPHEVGEILSVVALVNDVLHHVILLTRVCGSNLVIGLNHIYLFSWISFKIFFFLNQT